MEKENMYDWPALIAELTRHLRLKTTPIGMKMFKDEKDLLDIPKLRRPKDGEVFTTCQLVGQAARLNYTLGITKDNLPSAQCQAVIGLCSREEFVHSMHLTGIWYESDADSTIHQNAMYHFDEVYEAVVLSPLSSGRLKEPDVCIIYATPQQVMLIGNALQYKDYEVMTSTFVGESSCSDSWIRAIVTDKPSMTVPCYGERRYGGVLDEEMVIAFPPRYIHKILDGLNSLSKNGLRYPAPFYGLQHDVRAGISKNYDVDKLK